MNLALFKDKLHSFLVEFNKLNKFRKIFAIVFCSIIAVFTIYSLFRGLSYDGNELFFKLFLVAGLVITFCALAYLSIYDIAHFEVPGMLCILLPVSLLVVNILMGIVIGFNTNFTIWEGNSTTPMINIIGGLVGAGILGVIVYLTKGNGMGEGDIWILAALGFFIGYEKLIIGFYISIFSALFVGLVYSLRIKKLKGVPIPFVPFLVFGCLTAFVLALDYRLLLPIY